MAGKAEMALILSLVDEVTKTAKSIKGELESVGKTGQGLKGTLASVGTGLAKIGTAAVVGGIGLAVAGVTALGVASFRASEEITTAFDSMITQTGASGELLHQLQDDALAVFTTIPTSIDATTAVIGTLNQRLGVTGDAAQGLAKQLIQMGTDDAAQSAELYTRVLGDWGVATEDSAATLDKLFKASQLTGVGVDDLMGKVVQFGSPLRLMGFTLEESAAMFAKWEKEGVNGELVMGSLRIAAGKFAKETAEGSSVQMGGVKSMAEANIKLAELRENLAIATQRQSEFTDKTKASARMAMDKKIRDYASSITELEAAMAKGEFRTVKTDAASKSLGESLRETFTEIKNMTNGSDALAMGMEVFGARAGPDMVAAIREGRFEIEDLITAMGDSENAISKTAESWYGGFDLMQVASNKVKAALYPIGEAGEAAFGKVLAAAMPILDKLLAFAKTNIAPAIVTLGDALGQMVGGDLGGGLATLFGGETASTIMSVASAAQMLASVIGNIFGGGASLADMTSFMQAIMTIGTALGFTREQTAEFTKALFNVLSGARQVFDFLSANAIPIIAGVAAAILYTMVPAWVAQAAAAWAAVPAFLAAQAAMLPMIALVVAIGAAVALLVAAWMNDWGGIRTFLTEIWTNTLQPIFNTMVEWLQVNIPIALAALSAFWTGTLLPAIQAVWAFIQQNVIPLFQAIVSVYIAAFSLALTDLAGLWQNVLLPALQAVAGFITGSVVPAIQEAASWLGAKLTPIIERVAGWIDKAASSFGGLGISVQKVSTGIGKFAEWLSKITLPAWLTPGSPTPMENGLRGIAAALGPVVDQMFAFSKSMSGPQAENLKKIGSAFKDLAKGIDEIAGALSKLNSHTGPSTTMGDFGGWVDQFIAFATHAALSIDKVVVLIGYDRIHKLRLTARRLNEIIAAVLVDLSAIKERSFPDLDVWFRQLQDVFQRAVVVMNAIHGKWGLAVIDRAAQVAALVGQVLQILGTELGKAVPPPLTFEQTLADFLWGLGLAVDALVPYLSGLYVTLGGPVLNEAVKCAEALTAVVGVLGLATVITDLSKAEALLTTDFAPLIVALLAALLLATDLIVPMLDDIRVRWDETLGNASGAADAVTKVLGILGVDLTKIIPPPINFAAMLTGFLAALALGVDAIVPMLRNMRDYWSGPVLDDAAKTAEALGKVIGVLGLASVFAGLSDPKNAIKGNFLAMVTRLLTAMSSATDLLVPGLQAIRDKWGEALDKVADIAEVMKRVFTGVNDAQKAAIEFTSGGNINLGAFAARIAALNAASAAAVAGLAPAAPTATPTAPVVPGTPGAAATPAGGLDAAVIRDAIIEGIRGSELAIELSLVQDPNERARFSARLGRIENMFAEFVTKWEASNA